MKYLTVFKINSFEAAEAFSSKAAAEKFIHDCAKAAKTKAFKNQEGENYIITVNDKEGKSRDVSVEIQPIDAKLKYALNYDQNGQHVETSFHPTRKSLVARAQKILDGFDFEATAEETVAGKWTIEDAEQPLSVALTAKIATVGSENDNIIAEYANPDLKAYFKKIDAMLAQLALEEAAQNVADLQAARKKGLANLGIGIAIAAAGALLSYFSYQTSRPGEKYTVFTGLIVVGIIDALCGIYYIIRPKAALPKQKNSQK